MRWWAGFLTYGAVCGFDFLGISDMAKMEDKERPCTAHRDIRKCRCPQECRVLYLVKRAEGGR
jgi:hypothetical protein